MADLEKRVAQLEKEVAALKRIRIIAANLVAQEAADEANAKMMQPRSDSKKQQK